MSSRGSDSLASSFSLRDCQGFSIRRESHCAETFSIRDQIVEEPWLLQSSLVSHHVSDLDNSSDVDKERETLEFSNGDNQKSKMVNQSGLGEDLNHESDYDVNEMNSSERYDLVIENNLVEEPWIFESSASLDRSRFKMVSNVCRSESDKEEVTQSALDEQLQPIPENLLYEEESNLMTKEESVSTVILINSSICTVQRIAVLENDELVELLLEPVKTNVQCDSVYLGVVTKLVPHMGGAFVNIGSPRPSLMDIRPYREPFILHHLHGTMKEREVNGSIFDRRGEQLDYPENGAFSNGVEEPDEVDDDQSDDEFEGHDNHFHFDGLEGIKENVNDGVVGHECEVETHRFLQQQNGDVDQLQTKSNHQDASDKVIGTDESKWERVRKGSKIIVQVVKEGLGTKGPTLTAYPKLKSRFWVSNTRLYAL